MKVLFLLIVGLAIAAALPHPDKEAKHSPEQLKGFTGDRQKVIQAKRAAGKGKHHHQTAQGHKLRQPSSAGRPARPSPESARFPDSPALRRESAPSYQAATQVIIQQAGPSKQFGWAGRGKHGPQHLLNPFPDNLPKWIPDLANIFEAGYMYSSPAASLVPVQRNRVPTPEAAESGSGYSVPTAPASSPGPADKVPTSYSSQDQDASSAPVSYSLDPASLTYSSPSAPVNPASPTYSSPSAPVNPASSTYSSPSAPVSYSIDPASPTYDSAPGSSINNVPTPVSSSYSSAPPSTSSNSASGFVSYGSTSASSTYNSAPVPASHNTGSGSPSYSSVSAPASNSLDPAFASFYSAPGSSNYNSAPALSSYSSPPKTSTYISVPSLASYSSASGSFSLDPASTSYNSASASSSYSSIPASFSLDSSSSYNLPSDAAATFSLDSASSSYNPIPASVSSDPAFSTYNSAPAPASSGSAVAGDSVKPTSSGYRLASDPTGFSSGAQAPPGHSSADIPIGTGFNQGDSASAAGYTRAQPSPSASFSSVPNPAPFFSASVSDGYSSAPSAPSGSRGASAATAFVDHSAAPSFTSTVQAEVSSGYSQVNSQNPGDSAFSVLSGHPLNALPDEDVGPLSAYNVPITVEGYQTPTKESPEVFYIFYEQENAGAAQESSVGPTAGQLDLFKPPSDESIHTIYVPPENSINVPDVYGVAVGTSFGYSGPTDESALVLPDPSLDDHLDDSPIHISDEVLYREHVLANRFQNREQRPIRQLVQVDTSLEQVPSQEQETDEVADVPYGTRIHRRRPGL